MALVPLAGGGRAPPVRVRGRILRLGGVLRIRPHPGTRRGPRAGRREPDRRPLDVDGLSVRGGPPPMRGGPPPGARGGRGGGGGAPPPPRGGRGPRGTPPRPRRPPRA